MPRNNRNNRNRNQNRNQTGTATGLTGFICEGHRDEMESLLTPNLCGFIKHRIFGNEEWVKLLDEDFEKSQTKCSCNDCLPKKVEKAKVMYGLLKSVKDKEWEDFGKMWFMLKENDIEVFIICIYMIIERLKIEESMEELFDTKDTHCDEHYKIKSDLYMDAYNLKQFAMKHYIISRE